MIRRVWTLAVSAFFAITSALRSPPRWRLGARPQALEVTAASRVSRLAPLAIAVALVLAVVAGESAFAYWKAGGTGSGAGSTNTAGEVTLTSGAGRGDLHPGASGRVTTVATNPNPGSVSIAGVALDRARADGGIVVDNAHPACPASAFSFTTQDNGGAGWTVTGGSSRSIFLDGALTMAATAPDGCQGAVVTIYLRGTS